MKNELYRLLNSTSFIFYGWAELRAGRSGDRIPVGRDFPPIQTGPGAHQASSTLGTGSFPGVKYGRGVLLTPHPLLVLLSWKSRAIPLPTLRATTGPVTRKFYLLYVMVSRIIMSTFEYMNFACVK